MPSPLGRVPRRGQQLCADRARYGQDRTALFRRAWGDPPSPEGKAFVFYTITHIAENCTNYFLIFRTFVRTPDAYDASGRNAVPFPSATLQGWLSGAVHIDLPLRFSCARAPFPS